jgi:glucosamine--fructose-6-phosphate aminotransferase (isomerizing)
MTSLMLSETREAPALVEAALREDVDLYAALGRCLRQRPPAFVATVARGSSDHAAAYAASLFGILAGRVTATLAPSMVTRYGAKLLLNRALLLAVSQSGSSPDLVEVMAAARAAGSLTVTIVNAARAPLETQAHWVLPQRAGAEHSIAATKSFILTLLSIARLTAAWTEDAGLTAALPRLPDRLDAALACDWSHGLRILSGAPPLGAYVVGRGPALAVAQEAALKLKETSNLHAEAVSSAEIRHGPRAVVDQNFPILAFALDDPGGADTRALAAELSASGARVLLAAAKPNGPGLHLPLPRPLHCLLDPIPAALAFYPFAEALAQIRGLDPDHPRGLRKVTETV